MTAPAVIRVLFVCTGNICRSPTAEGVMRAIVEEAGLSSRFELDSAGTDGWHAGELPDERSRTAAARRGIVLTHRARQVRDADFASFDHILAMDREHLVKLEQRASKLGTAKLALFRAYDPSAPPGAEVPDPYYGGEAGFEAVLDMCERACRGLVSALGPGSTR